MTPRDKAIQIFRDLHSVKSRFKADAKECAIILVNEILEEKENYLDSPKYMMPSDTIYQTHEERVEFWNKVKHELQIL